MSSFTGHPAKAKPYRVQGRLLPALMVLIATVIIGATLFILRSTRKDEGPRRAQPTIARAVDGAELVWVPGGPVTIGTSNQEILSLIQRLTQWRRLVSSGEEESATGVMYRRFEFGSELSQQRLNAPGFWIYKNEVTCGQFARFLKAFGSMRSAPVDGRIGRPQPWFVWVE